jgi:hypothetical protein
MASACAEKTWRTYLEDIMNTLAKILCVVALMVGVAAGTTAWAAGQAPAPPHAKNWTAPAYKIYAQTLSDEIMAKHPELLSVTFHGVPPGMDKVYTMFAGSFPERIGNTDDPDDIDVQTKGITILDPRWHRKDPVPKFSVMMPLRDVGGENVGLIVFAYKNPPSAGKGEREYLAQSTVMRDALQKQIPTYKGLFDKAK